MAGAGEKDIIRIESRWALAMGGLVAIILAVIVYTSISMGMNPPKYLQPGDFVELGIDGLGEMGQRIVAG
jgi:2-keto-4-pentenoate hydratase/2-oxohepta-3-ene-1,7-dioic acid hydratase in catechol pathway